MCKGAICINISALVESRSINCHDYEWIVRFIQILFGVTSCLVLLLNFEYLYAKALAFSSNRLHVSW